MMRWYFVGASLLAISGCGNELADCDTKAANELVYSRSGRVATKGQALAHDSCGSGSYCHSASARGSERWGAPHGMNFDMLPVATGLNKIRALDETSWRLVDTNQMPPRGKPASVLGDGDWLADPQRRSGAPKLPKITTEAGKGIFRNWLACGAPVVSDTRVPDGVQMGTPVEATWASIYSAVLKPTCATAGQCHNADAGAGGLSFPDDECAAYAELFQQGDCKETLVKSGAPDESFLIHKVEVSKPRCGDFMPPGGELDDNAKSVIREWIRLGARAPGCSTP